MTIFNIHALFQTPKTIFNNQVYKAIKPSQIERYTTIIICRFDDKIAMYHRKIL